MGGGILNGWEAREMGENYAKMSNILQSLQRARGRRPRKKGQELGM